MSPVTLRRTYWFKAAAVIGSTMFVFSRPAFFVNATESAVTAIAAVELTDAERSAITSELQRLQQRLAVLRTNPAVKPEHWADADGFIKGVIWAIVFGPIKD